MLTATIAQNVLNAIKEMTSKVKVFTAFDVTMKLRDETEDHINHNDVRSIVHNEYAIGELPDTYNTECIDLNNGERAIVYYPDGKQATDHLKAKKSTSADINPVVALDKIVSSKARQGGSVKDGNSCICKATAEGRINVPKEIIAQVTINGGTYDIVASGKAIYGKPNSDGRVRISISELGGGSRFCVSVDTASNTITIDQV